MTKEPKDWHKKFKKNDTVHKYTPGKTEFTEDDIERHKKIPPRHKGEYIYTPGKTELTQEDIDEAIEEWNKTMPGYEGLLDAEIEEGDDD